MDAIPQADRVTIRLSNRGTSGRPLYRLSANILGELQTFLDTRTRNLPIASIVRAVIIIGYWALPSARICLRRVSGVEERIRQESNRFWSRSFRRGVATSANTAIGPRRWTPGSGGEQAEFIRAFLNAGV